jgi:hypothetical protein
MYGKWVTLNLGEGIECRVFVSCSPSTPDEELKHRAVEIAYAAIHRAEPKRATIEKD